MPTPVVPLREIRESVRAYDAALAEGFRPAYTGLGHRNAVTRAAEVTGLGVKSMRGRLDLAAALGIAVANWPAPDPEWARGVHLRYLVEDPEYAGGNAPRQTVAPQPFTPPFVPASDLPVEDAIRRRIEAFERQKASRDARRWMRFTINEDAPFGLCFVGDPHLDDNGCDWPTLMRHIETMEETPGLYGVGMGDWLNSWTGRLTRIYASQSTTVDEGWRYAEWLLRKRFWMLLLRGNHDMWNGDSDPLKWICNGAAPLQDWRAQFEVACGDAVWRIDAAHNFPGRSMWNKLHGPLKQAKATAHAADLYVAADQHIWAVAEEQDEHTGRRCWLARAKGYKTADTYALVNGFGQEQDRGQTVVAVCDPETRRMACFSDVEEGADFLGYLRRRRAA